MKNLLTPGEPAPEFELLDVNGQQVTLSTVRENKIVVLYFLRGFM